MLHLDQQKEWELIHEDVKQDGHNRINDLKSKRARTELLTHCWNVDCYANPLTTSEGVTAPSIWKGLRVPRNEQLE